MLTKRYLGHSLSQLKQFCTSKMYQYPHSCLDSGLVHKDYLSSYPLATYILFLIWSTGT